MAKIDDKSINVSGLELKNLTQEEKRRLPRLREGSFAVARQALLEYERDPEPLRLQNFDVAALLANMEDADKLTPYEEWLERYAMLVHETRLWHQAAVRRGLDRLVRRVRSLVEEEGDEELRSRFADLLDFYSEPARKAGNTRRSKNTKQEK